MLDGLLLVDRWQALWLKMAVGQTELWLLGAMSWGEGYIQLQLWVQPKWN